MNINSKKRGRPLGFDRPAALHAAMLTFWQFGYAGTSITDLTRSMGISAQSLYSSFGSKSELYHEALDLYQNSFCLVMKNALAQTGNCLLAIENMLLKAAQLYTDTTHPRGCMIATANLGCASENCQEVIYLSRLRKNMTRRIHERISLGIKAGDLISPKTNADTLSTYISMLLQGMSVQAQDGATETELACIVENVMKMIRQEYTHKENSTVLQI